MTNQAKNVPELRFSEFDGEWEEKKLNQIVKFSKGKLLGKKDLDDSGENYCILYGELYTKYGFFINEVISKTNVSIEKLVKGENNQVLLPSSGETAEDIATASSLNVKNDVYIGGDLNILTPINKDGNFISLSMNGINKWKIAKLSQGKTVVHLYNEHLKTLNLNIPVSREEQQKISEFFGKLDRQIELEKQKLAKLEEQKKAYMQKIFSQELRFKDENGNEYPEWEEKEIQDLMEVTSVKRIHQSDWKTNGVQFLRARDIVAINKGEKIKEPLFISYDKYNEYSRISGKVEKDDLLVTGVGTIGVPHLIKDNKPLYFKDGNIIWLKNRKILEGKFLFYSFLNVKIQSYIKRVAGVGTVGTYTILNAKKTPIYEPIKKEQIKIGEFFMQIDNFIEKQSNKVESLKQRKKGLLQKMFI
ncbi:restriction endonuclease subunit S [Mammaliicoccus sciuri]|uniref:restriction endonuclease subunit S n=1 Tax=Mammaliicoccus sciuri TaxID=1296 RepID=UPI0021D0E15D|nr:restriction endonuclease subunit S [Mammaliicoccus sciuri]UXU69179.1 restriction endonuclease subunit S [Mammaliicoccus sciuri]